MALSAQALAAGTSLLVVTLGPRGAVYVAAPGFDRLRTEGLRNDAPVGAPVRTARIPAATAEMLDPTGCGDVFGGTLCARLLSGVPVETALGAAARMAARNAGHRGASELARVLRGEWVIDGGTA
jgi:sugar/nucleoside kinase (ribokinase family)